MKLMKEAGMTLIEIMIVVTILGLIATIVAVNVIGQLDQAKVKKAEIEMKTFETALDSFRRDNSFYPSTEQGLGSLIEKPSMGRSIRYFPRGGYLKSKGVPRDPWGCEYIYHSPGLQGNPYEITSLGADCQEGGDDVDADIHSWELGLEKQSQ